MKLYNPLNREKILDDYEIKLRSTDQRLQSLEKNNLVLHQRIKTLEEENERLVTSLKRNCGGSGGFSRLGRKSF